MLTVSCMRRVEVILDTISATRPHKSLEKLNNPRRGEMPRCFRCSRMTYNPITRWPRWSAHMWLREAAHAGDCSQVTLLRWPVFSVMIFKRVFLDERSTTWCVWYCRCHMCRLLNELQIIYWCDLICLCSRSYSPKLFQILHLIKRECCSFGIKNPSVWNETS